MSVNEKMTAIADNIRAKTGGTEPLTLDGMAESIPAVYSAGQSSMVDESKLIPKTVSGSYISVDDVSEIPHSVGCKVESVNLCKEEVESGYYYDGAPNASGADAKYIRILPFAVEPLTTYTFSANLFVYSIWFCGADGGIERISWANSYVRTITTPENCTELRITLMNKSGAADTTAFEYAMLNKGTTALPYTPYVKPEEVKVTKYGEDESEGYQTLTPAADGTIEGMTSTSPYMNIFSDTEGVNIEATYNKSYGMQTEYDRFWDNLQNYGKRVGYTYGFMGSSWNDTTFRPKYDINPDWSIVQMFANSKITDLEKILNECGVSLITRRNGNYTSTFGSAAFTVLPHITFGIGTINASQTFGSSTSLHTIRKITIEEGVTAPFTSTFTRCTSLANVEFDGVIPTSINFQWCPLTKASITNIINTLSTTATGQTLTLKLSAVNTAFETSSGAGDGSTSAEFAALVATKTNWTITMI